MPVWEGDFVFIRIFFFFLFDSIQKNFTRGLAVFSNRYKLLYNIVLSYRLTCFVTVYLIVRVIGTLFIFYNVVGKS